MFLSNFNYETPQYYFYKLGLEKSYEPIREVLGQIYAEHEITKIHTYIMKEFI